MTRHTLLACVWGLALVATTAPLAHAQTTYTWNGGGAGGLWSDPANWGGTAPVSDLSSTGTRIALAGTTSLTTDLDFGGTFDINGLTVANGAGAFIVNSVVNPTTLRIGGNGIAVNTGSNFTINAPILLGANQTWTNAGQGTAFGTFTAGAVNLNGNTLTVAGGGATVISGSLSGGGTVTNNATVPLLVSGGVNLAAGATTFGGTGTTNITGIVSGANGLTKTGAGTVVLAGANTYTGPTAVNAGVLVVNSSTAGATPLGAAAINLGGGTLSFRTAANPIAVSGFNQDVISSASDLNTPNPFGTTTSLDNAFGVAVGYVLYEKNALFAGGLPNGTATAGGTFTSAANAYTTYRLAPYGQGGVTVPNDLLLADDAGGGGTALNSGRLTLTTSGKFQTVSALVMGGGGTANFTAKLNFSDGTSTTVTGLAAPDWFFNNPFAINALGRMTRQDGIPSGDEASGNPRMYPVDINLSATDQAKTLTSIDFTRTGGGRFNVFGVSGAAVGGTTAFSNVVNVTDSSTIEMLNTPVISFGGLTIGSKTLTTIASGSTSVAFAGTTLSGDPTFNVATGQVFNTATIDFGNAARTITKTGGGTQQFDFAAGNVNGTNTLVVSGGTANVTNASALGASPNLTVSSGTANLNVNNVAINSLTMTGGATNFNNAGATVATAIVNGGTTNVNAATAFTTLSGTSGTINVTGVNVVTVGGSNVSTTWGGSLAGTGTVNKVGTGILTLTAAGGTNTGGITISAGQVTATQPGSLGAGAVTLSDGTTLAIGGNPPPTTTISGFGTNGSGWTPNGSATVANNVLTVTPNANSQAGSAWYNTQQPTSSFVATFDYTRGTGSGNPADGFTFTLQNRATNPLTALGGAGGSLGYGGASPAISPSAAIEVNIYNPNGRGIAVRTNGAVAGGGNYTATGSVDFFNNTTTFNVAYNATSQALNITLTQGANTYSFPTQTVDLSSILGANTYVGFTGGTGGENAVQQISNFTFGLGLPGLGNYTNAVKVADAATANLTPIVATGVTSFTMGGLTLGAGSTLNVQPATGSLANTTYSTSLGATTLAGSGTINVLNNGTGGGTVTLGAVSGASGNLVKTGAGTLVLSAGGTYGGTTTVSAGTLQVGGTLGTGGAVAVQNGALLNGTGTVNRDVVVQTGGTLQGGLGVTAASQAITTGTTTFNNGGTLRAVVSNAGGTAGGSSVLTDGSGASRVIAGQFGLDAAGSVMNILVVSEAGANALLINQGTTYTRRLATYTSLNNLAAGVYNRGDANNPFNVTGQSATGQTFDAGAWQVQVGQGGNFVDLVFTPVPEPTTVLGIAAVGMGAVGLVRRLRRRQAETALAA